MYLLGCFTTQIIKRYPNFETKRGGKHAICFKGDLCARVLLMGSFMSLGKENFYKSDSVSPCNRSNYQRLKPLVSLGFNEGVKKLRPLPTPLRGA